jgi:hypothetical protein
VKAGAALEKVMAGARQQVGKAAAPQVWEGAAADCPSLQETVAGAPQVWVRVQLVLGRSEAPPLQVKAGAALERVMAGAEGDQQVGKAVAPRVWVRAQLGWETSAAHHLLVWVVVVAPQQPVKG